MIDIRLGNHHNKDAAASQELIDAIREFPGSCDTVWFATEYGYPELSKHKESADKMEEIAELYRKAGIKVSLQISNTIGHGEYMKSRDNSAIDSHKFEKIIGPDGTVSDYSFCWRGKNFTDYICKSIEVYMNIRPATVWIDDDLRVLNHAPVQFGCFCDICLKEFNEKHGTSYTREELVNEINYGDLSVREKFVEFTRQGMYDFTLKLTESVQKLSPDTQMALQYARVSNYVGMDYNFLFDAMRDGSGKTVKSRPGGGVYDDKTPMRLLDKMLWVGYSNCAVPEYVTENYPEIENTPDVPFGKSIYGTIKESTLYLAYGCTGLTYAVLMTPYEKIDFHKKMLRAFSEYRSYWDELAKRSSYTKNGGALIYDPPKAYMRKINEDEPLFSWQNEFENDSYIRTPQTLMKVGVPVTLDKDGGNVLIVSAKTVDCMRDEDIVDILTKPVIIDGPGFKKIIDRGFGWAFDATSEPVTFTRYKEVFTDHIVNRGNEGRPWNESFFTGVPMPPHVIKGKDIEPIGMYVSLDTNEDIDASCASVNAYDKNKNVTAKWAVFGYCRWKDILGTAKRQQILYAIDYISGNTLPAILESAEQVVVLPRVTKDMKTSSVTLCNASIGKTDEMTLRIRNAVGDKFRLRNADIDIVPKAEKCGDDYVLTIPSLGGWEIATVFID